MNGGGAYAYGFGWQVDAVAGRKRVHHSGTMPGFRATMHRYLDDKLTVIVLANDGNADPGSIARLIAESYVPGSSRRGPLCLSARRSRSIRPPSTPMSGDTSRTRR